MHWRLKIRPSTDNFDPTFIYNTENVFNSNSNLFFVSENAGAVPRNYISSVAHFVVLSAKATWAQFSKTSFSWSFWYTLCVYSCHGYEYDGKCAILVQWVPRASRASRDKPKTSALDHFVT